MDVLRKTIKKLSDAEYNALLQQVSGKKKNKPYMVLEAARSNEGMEDSEMMQVLQVNPSAYYTLKSRLNSKIASILSQKVENPIRGLMEEVVRVPATLYANNKEFAIRALIELEKQLIEYDMSNELIVVYKTLAQLHLYTPDHDYYQKQYTKHVAFALAVQKAEQLFFRFIKQMGNYLLTHKHDDLEELVLTKRELSNICELYDSHRLYVLYNVTRIYYVCAVPEKRESLKSMELDIETTLKKIEDTFNKFPNDTFYNNLKHLSDVMNFEYYQKINNQVRADFYFQKINSIMPEWAGKHSLAFFVIQFLYSKTEKYINDGNIEQYMDNTGQLESVFDIDQHEAYHYLSFKRFLAVCKFYQRDYHGAAKSMNALRNSMSMKHYQHTDIENKLFQALNYCILGEESLCQQIISSLKRQISEADTEYQSAKIFIKVLKTAMKPCEYRKKIKRINDLLTLFNEKNHGSKAVLQFVKIDETTVRKMTNPIKE